MPVSNPTGAAPGLQIHPTAFCNLACAHCYTSSGPAARGELPLALLEPVLADAVALGYRDLAVSGGEPLLYSQLDGLLAAAKALGLPTSLTTNGLVLPDRMWNRVAPLIDLLAVSIDGRPDEHDRIRRRRGAFDKTVANIGLIGDSGVPFGLIFTLTQHNADSVDFVVRLAADLGARFVQVHPMTLVGRAATDMTGARPDAVERMAGLVEALRCGQEHGIPVHVDLLTAGQIAGFRCALVPSPRPTALAEVAPTLVVTPEADVVPMSHEIDRVLHLGNLRDSPLRHLAARWMADGRAEALASACARTWDDLRRGDPMLPHYWYDEVALRTRACQPA